MTKRSKLLDPMVIIDVHERDNAVTRAIQAEEITTIVKCAKEGTKYDPTSDYTVVDRLGHQWGIERKSFLDCWQSICSKRIYGQLAQLCEKYPERAILMLEAPQHFPAALMSRRYAIMSSVYTFFDDRALIMPCWYVMDPKHAAHVIIKHAYTAHRNGLHGRGIKVTLDGNQ